MLNDTDVGSFCPMVTELLLTKEINIVSGVVGKYIYTSYVYPNVRYHSNITSHLMNTRKQDECHTPLITNYARNRV